MEMRAEEASGMAGASGVSSVQGHPVFPGGGGGNSLKRGQRIVFF